MMNQINVFTVFMGLSVASCVSQTMEKHGSSRETLDRADCLLPRERYLWSGSNYPKLIWLSIDSLNRSGLEEIVSNLKNPHSKGFKWLLQAQNKNHELIIKEPTITASSHISTATCSSAGKHGIFANTQWDGSKFISGFSTPFRTDTFATVLKNSGLKVVSAGHPALDNSEPGRTVSEGFTYGNQIGKSQIHTHKLQQNLVHAWKDSKDNIIETLIVKNSDFSDLKNFKCEVKNCKFSRSAVENIVDVTFLDDGKPLRAYAQLIEGNQNQIFVSALSSNTSFPELTRVKQESCDLIFSPGKDNYLGQFGPRNWIRGLQHRLDFFDKNWAHYLPTTKADVIFLYLEDIDSIRHQYSGDVASQPIVNQHYERVDKVIGELISSLPNTVNFIIMGDHGMSTVKQEINIRKVIPEHILSNYVVITTGGTALFYHKYEQARDLSSIPSKKELGALEFTKRNLLQFKSPTEGALVFEKIFIKSTQEMKDSGLSHANSPFMITIANDNFSLQNSMSSELILADSVNPKLPAPRPRGQHGHVQESSKMKAFVAGWGPAINKIDLRKIESNVALVPAVGKALGWAVPNQCMNK